MNKNISITLPEKIVKYLQTKSKEQYLSISAVARQYLAKTITQEMVFEYYNKGYSLSKISELVELPISKVMEILKSNEQIISDEDLEEVIEK